jgi:hypothetical protein
MKHQILGLIVVLGAIGVTACEPTPTPQKDAVAEQKAAQEAKDKIAKAEKEAAEKTEKAKKEADEKMAAAAKDLAEIKYQSFVGLRDYKALVASRLDENEKKLVDLKTKGDAKAGTMTADAKKEWADIMKTAEGELKQARTDLKTVDAATETTWSTTKARVDTSVKNFAKSVDNLGQKINSRAQRRSRPCQTTGSPPLDRA